jgi:putative CocE/NonD family hydrolase
VFRGLGREGERTKLDELKVDPAVRFSALKDESVRHLPVSDWIERLGEGAPFLEDVLYHSVDGPYWWANDMRRQLHDIDVPMLHIGSWYDINTWDTPLLFNGLKDQAMSHYARSHQALFMGPWAHLLPYSQPTSGNSGDIDFGRESEVFLPEMYLRWFDHFLKGDGEGLPVPPVRLFVMGENRWRDETEWPPTRTDPTPWYLHSGGGANTLDGDGSLTPVAPSGEPADHYSYDPDDPVPTCGGHSVGGGVADQRANQARSDVLVYTSAPLVDELEITGPVTAELFVATSAVDTDFVVCLSDVHPDGFCQNLLESIVRGRFRSSYTTPTLLEPGQVYPLTVELWNTSHIVRPGHRLRVHVTSSDFPRWERNLNTGSRAAYGKQMEVAHQSLYHDAEHPSRVILPVVPR